MKNNQTLPEIDKYYKPVEWNQFFKPKYNVVFVIQKPEFLQHLENKILGKNESKGKN